jgi:hypothetical protein
VGFNEAHAPLAVRVAVEPGLARSFISSQFSGVFGFSNKRAGIAAILLGHRSIIVVCSEILMIQWEYQDYQAGVNVNYAPLANGTTTFNSNSFTYTLLWDIGLGKTFTPYVGWAPGWGYLVPGLH